jgi:hypothetical protein
MSSHRRSGKSVWHVVASFNVAIYNVPTMSESQSTFQAINLSRLYSKESSPGLGDAVECPIGVLYRGYYQSNRYICPQILPPCGMKCSLFRHPSSAGSNRESRSSQPHKFHLPIHAKYRLCYNTVLVCLICIAIPTPLDGPKSSRPLNSWRHSPTYFLVVELVF